MAKRANHSGKNSANFLDDLVQIRAKKWAVISANS